MVERNFSLDIVRASAILLVLFSHAARFAPFSDTVHTSIAPTAGIVGVELFFALSGFLIGRLLLKENTFPDTRKKLQKFWVRRWMRTLPAYYFVLLTAPLISYLINTTGDFNYPEISRYLFFVQNFTTSHPEYFGVAWSLSIEEWSYVFVPIVLLFLSVRFKLDRKNSLLLCSALLIVVASFIRFQYATSLSSAQWDSEFRKVVLFRIDAIAYGLLAALVEFTRKRINLLHTLLLLAGCLFCYQQSKAASGEINTISAQLLPLVSGVCFAAIVCWMSQQKIRMYQPVYKVITHLSIISYSLYLIHSPLWELTLAILPNDASPSLMWIFFIGYIAASILSAKLIYNIIESPVLKLREHIQPARSGLIAHS